MANDSNSKFSLTASTSPELRKNYIRSLLDNVFVQFLAFGMLVAAIVAILIGGLDDRGQQLDESMIGQVAPYTVEADRDFSFTETDVAASNELRQDVAMSVPPVYDWQEQLGESIRDDISEAFSATRQAMAEEARQSLEEESPQQLDDIVEQTADDAFEQRELIETLSETERLRLARELRSDYFDPELDVRLSDYNFEVFARRAFVSDIESALRTLVDDVMSNLLVDDLEQTQERGADGIYLRRLHDDESVIEYHISDIDDRFVDFGDRSQLVDDAVARHNIVLTDNVLREAIAATASTLLEANTTYNDDETLDRRRAARDSVADQVIHEDFREGQVIVEKGHVITERDYRIVEEMLDGDETYHATQVLSGIALFGLLLLIILYGFGRRNIRNFRPGPRDIVFMGTTLLLMLLITRVGTAVGHALAEQVAKIPVEAWYFAIPVAAGGMLIRLVLESEHAILFTILFGILVGIVADNSLFFAAYTILGTLVGVTTVQQVKHRMALMWSGLAVGAVNAAAIIGFLLLQGEFFQMTSFAYIVLGFGGGVAAGFFISAVLPVFESVFGYTTDIKLLELANLNHPLLRELILRAPGSYHHSMMVGSLCEAAAEAIGANALLARVGSYYHDIGKAKNPQYFAENQKGENPHDKLKPNMSALIIKSHVKDGLDMARRHRLPAEIQDFIAQHHGTSLIAYFYHKAKDAEDPDIPEVTEKDFRYPGPRPQTRETAIALLADGVEAASRAMPNPSPARLKGLVQTMINKAFTDGQLDECDLTLKDLNKIAKAFTRILNAIYHHRPEYPDDNNQKQPDTSGTVRHKVSQSDSNAASDPEGAPGADGTTNGNDDSDDRGAQNARRGNDNGSSDKSSGNRKADREGHESPRGDLPRLGSS